MIEYIGIKVKGIGHWFWFEIAKTVRSEGRFIGREGWGKGGAFTNIEISIEDIVGEIHSDTPQYK